MDYSGKDKSRRLNLTHLLFNPKLILVLQVHIAQAVE